MLSAYNLTRPLTLACDEAPFGVAVVVAYRFLDGSKRPVTYTSKSLEPAERNYSRLNKEALTNR